MGLNSDKTSKVFCINICCFSTRLYIFWYHNGTVIQVSWKLWMFLICAPHKTRTFTVRLAVTTKYQGNGFAAEVLLGRDYHSLMTVIAVLTCCCIPNCIKIGSRVRPPDAHNCWMFNAPLVGSGHCHGNPILADMSGTWWDATGQVSSQ